MKIEFRIKTDELLMALKDMFEKLNVIELSIGVSEKTGLMSSFCNINEFVKDYESPYEEIEIALKESLDFKIKKEFAETFIKEGLGIESVEEEDLEKFVKAVMIFFDDENVLKIESEKCSKYPVVFFYEPFSQGKYLKTYIIENSTCEEIRSIQIKHFFGNGESALEITDFIESKLVQLLRNDLSFIQNNLNEYYRSKMDWVIEL